MWCSLHECSAIVLTERTSGDITIKVGRCRVGNEVLMEKWRKVRAIPLKENSTDTEALMRVASFQGGIKNAKTSD